VIVVAGEALTDLLVRPDGSISAVPGGSMFNAARTIARLGQSVAFVGRLSDDGFGRTLRTALIADGVDGSLIEATSAPTTLAIAELDDGGSASYRFHWAETAAPGLSVAAVRAGIERHPEVLYVGSLGLVFEPMASSIADGVASAARATLVMLDPNCRPAVIADRRAYRDRLSAVARRADLLKLSREDLDFLSPGIEPIEAMRAWAGEGPAVVLLTNGAKPVVAVGRTFAFEVPVPDVTVVDTVGAGDAFGGAFVARWVEVGLGRAELADEGAVHETVGWAVQVAARTCARAGADPPYRHELP
jgi:fructokinase